MSNRWWIRIATKTTPRKQLAIWKAKTGGLDTGSRDYMQNKYLPALYSALRQLMQPAPWFSNEDVRDFIQECVDDTFVRIKEYDSQFKFRTFLVNKIILPKLKTLLSETAKRKEAEKDYVRTKYSEIKQKLPSAFRQNLLEGFIKDALRKLKEDDPIKYEVFCYRHYDELPYSEVIKKVKVLYPEVSSEAYARQLYQRAEKELKHITREIYEGDPSLARKLPIGKGLKQALSKETTVKPPKKI
jgi:DNA-directed RNA polymerase specialized sigma24 family protein